MRGEEGRGITAAVQQDLLEPLEQRELMGLGGDVLGCEGSQAAGDEGTAMRRQEADAGAQSQCGHERAEEFRAGLIHETDLGAWLHSLPGPLRGAACCLVTELAVAEGLPALPRIVGAQRHPLGVSMAHEQIMKEIVVLTWSALEGEPATSGEGRGGGQY
jgi:hypothetical protein